MLHLNRVWGICLSLGFVTSLLSPCARADVRLPRVFSDRMVVQRDQPIPVWGWAAPTEEITITVGESNTAKVIADDNGHWRVKLAAMPAGGPHKLSVAGKNTLTIQDVLVGEV